MAHTLYIRDGETFSEAQPQDIIDRAATLISQRFRTGAPVLDSPDRTRQYLRHQIGALPYEVFGLLLLDCRHRLIRSEILFRGTIDGAAVPLSAGSLIWSSISSRPPPTLFDGPLLTR